MAASTSLSPAGWLSRVGRTATSAAAASAPAASHLRVASSSARRGLGSSGPSLLPLSSCSGCRAGHDG